ncbi:hypothetical protein D046_5823B, partial [Vibrio parahaemolyticus V-223/04]
QITLVKKWDFN